MRAKNLCGIAAALGLLAGCAETKASRSSHQTQHAAARDGVTMQHAKGPFQVEIKPQPISDVAASAELGRMSINKTFSGDLDATSRGEMLSAMSSVKGSAGYVAMERVTGKLAGKSGTFVLQHRGLMNRGTPTLLVEVVPDSGTGELVGLSGTMTIDIVNKEHLYDFTYSLTPVR